METTEDPGEVVEPRHLQPELGVPGPAPSKPPTSLEIPAYFETFPADIRDYRHIPGPIPAIPPASPRPPGR